MANTKNITFDQLQTSMNKVKASLDKKANTIHGYHVPDTQSANNATYLRNDNTWHTITPSDINAAPVTHGTHVDYATNAPKAAGTASVGSSGKVAREDHVHPLQTSVSGSSGSCTGNADTATTLQTARTLTIGNSGKSFNGSANVSWSLSEIGAIPLNGSTSISGDLEFSNSGTTTRGIVGTVGDNDFWRVVGGATATNSGFLEIATADDGSEPIYVRQYNNGKFSTLARTATLLDESGNTSFPGTVTASSFSGDLNGTANKANTLATSVTINGTSFNGSKNITTTRWGTARNIYIADSDSTNTGSAVSVNGSADATLKLPGTIKASLTGNASTATTLQTARTINGTSFNGSRNITTANWGTSRTITIGNTSKSINGSSDISWTLSEIGAEPITKTLVSKSAKSGTIALTTDRYQAMMATGNVTISLPYTSNDLEEIHFFIYVASTITITVPSDVKIQTIPSISNDNVYEFIFTYISGIGWLCGAVEYA